MPVNCWWAKIPSANAVKFYGTGASLASQRLRLTALNAGVLGSLPGQVTRSHKPQLRPSTGKEINIILKNLWYICGLVF